MPDTTKIPDATPKTHLVATDMLAAAATSDDTAYHVTGQAIYNAPIGGVLNVKDYSTLALAFAALGAQGGGKLIIPDDDYEFSSTITIPNVNYTIEGNGEKTKLHYTATDGTDAFYRENYVATYSKQIWRDLCLYGAGAGEATGSGIHLYYTIGAFFDNVDVRDFGGGSGIWLQGMQEFGIRGGDYRGNNYGLQLGPTATDLWAPLVDLQTAVGDISGIQTSYNNLAGVFVNGDSSGLVGNIRINGVIQGEKRDGILLDYCISVKLDNVWFELNNSDVVAGCADVRTTNQCDKLLMDNCKASDTPINLSLASSGSCNGSLILNCTMNGDITLGASCSGTRFFGSNVCTGGGDVFTDNGNYNQRYDYLNYHGSKAWTPGTIGDGAFAWTTVPMDRTVPNGTPMQVGFVGANFTLGMWCSAYASGTDAYVTMHNESGASKDVGAGTVTVHAIGEAIPY